MIKQEAILLTKNNASVLAEKLCSFTTEDLLEEANHLFKLNGSVVLVTDEEEQGTRILSYIVHESLYKANNSNFADLNDKTYTQCVPVYN